MINKSREMKSVNKITLVIAVTTLVVFFASIYNNDLVFGYDKSLIDEKIEEAKTKAKNFNIEQKILACQSMEKIGMLEDVDVNDCSTFIYTDDFEYQLNLYIISATYALYSDYEGPITMADIAELAGSTTNNEQDDDDDDKIDNKKDKKQDKDED